MLIMVLKQSENNHYAIILLRINVAFFFLLKKNKAVMFDADMVVLYQVLYETTQQIVSGKGSLTIRTHF